MKKLVRLTIYTALDGFLVWVIYCAAIFVFVYEFQVAPEDPIYIAGFGSLGLGILGSVVFLGLMILLKEGIRWAWSEDKGHH